MERTQPVEWINKSFIGYVITAEFSPDNSAVIMGLINEIKSQFGDTLFCMPKVSLHTTLLEWIAPLVDYGGADKDALFRSVQPTYNIALTNILASCGPITVQFDTIKVAPTTIFIVGHDDGQFQKIRDQFVNSIELLPPTKLPPQIIHSSLARFTKPIEIETVSSFVATKTLDLTQTVTSFRLTRATKEPLLDFEILKRYELT